MVAQISVQIIIQAVSQPPQLIKQSTAIWIHFSVHDT